MPAENMGSRAPLYLTTIFLAATSTLAAQTETLPPQLIRFSTSKPEKHMQFYDPARESTSQDKGFRWKPALLQAGKFLALQQGVMFANDKWTRYNTVHGKYFQDWAAGVRGAFTQWDDGDPWLDNYVGHPLQGAVIGYVQVQNDPQGAALEFSWSKRYWISRMKATAFNAAYSTQFEIGPISEAAFSNLGSYKYQNCPRCKVVDGAGWADLIMTPVGGLGWMVAEDALDRYVVKRTEGGRHPGRWSNFLRTALNPSRTAANILAGKKPWYRVRDELTDAPRSIAIPGRLEAQQIGEAARGREH
jgi:hypothetical protein